MDQSLEIYRQRYETFRHLDRLRWQMMQLLVAVLSASALVYRSSPNGVGGWFWGFLGLAFLTIALVMTRISHGIARNGDVLREFGAKVGDDRIPDARDRLRSVAHWLTLAIGFGGVCCLIAGINSLDG